MSIKTKQQNKSTQEILKLQNIKIDDNFLYKKMTENIAEVVKIDIMEEKTKKRISKNKKYHFYKELFYLLKEVDYKLLDLNACVGFISTYPNRKSLRKIFNRYQYITYHLEYYYINIVSLYDRLLKIANFLYNLGLKDKYIQTDIIKSNSNVDKDVVKQLKKIDKAITRIRKVQNTIKHRSKLREPSEEFNRANFYEELVNLNDLKFSKKEINMMKFIAKFNYSFFISKKKKELIKNNKILLILVDNFYASLIPQFKKRTKNFK